MKIAIFQDSFPQEILNEFSSRNIEYDIFYFSEVIFYVDNSEDCMYYDKKKIIINDYDGAIVYVGNVIFTSRIAEYFEKVNKWVSHNCSTINIIKDKHKTLQYLKNSSIPIPKTYYMNDRVYDVNKDFISTSLSYPIIKKPNNLSYGSGVVLIKNSAFTNLRDDARINYAERNNIFEECIGDSGKDLRVLTIGDSIFGGFWRINENNIASNLHRGGKGIVAEVSDEIKQLCINAVKAIPGRCFLCGVDVIFDLDNKPYILELNTHPGLVFEREWWDYDKLSYTFVDEMIKSIYDFYTSSISS